MFQGGEHPAVDVPVLPVELLVAAQPGGDGPRLRSRRAAQERGRQDRDDEQPQDEKGRQRVEMPGGGFADSRDGRQSGRPPRGRG